MGNAVSDENDIEFADSYDVSEYYGHHSSRRRRYPSDYSRRSGKSSAGGTSNGSRSSWRNSEESGSESMERGRRRETIPVDDNDTLPSAMTEMAHHGRRALQRVHQRRLQGESSSEGDDGDGYSTSEVDSRFVPFAKKEVDVIELHNVDDRVFQKKYPQQVAEDVSVELNPKRSENRIKPSPPVTSDMAMGASMSRESRTEVEASKSMRSEKLVAKRAASMSRESRTEVEASKSMRSEKLVAKLSPPASPVSMTREPVKSFGSVKKVASAAQIICTGIDLRDNLSKEEEDRDPPEDDDQSVEASYRQNPEEKMAKSILNARIKRALFNGEDLGGDEGPIYGLASLQTMPSTVNAEDVADVLHELGDVDFNFVQQYEMAFEVFIQENIGLMARNPELIYNLRVAKLQKVLQVTSDIEADLQQTFDNKNIEREGMVETYKLQLIEAAKKKAALEVHLKKELATIKRATKTMEGKLKWEVIQKNDQRAKRHYQLLQHLARNEATSLQTLIELIPDQVGMQAIRNAASLPPCRKLSNEQEKDLRQYQVDNSFLNAEVNVLEKKLAYEQALAKKYAWVDSLLIRMDSSHMNKLKRQFHKKLGIAI